MFKAKETETYYSTNEMLAAKGYQTYTPKIGSLGSAIMSASREHSNEEWLKKQLDVMFTKLRREEKGEGKSRGKRKKQNS